MSNMISEILTPQQCAKCRGCCIFEPSEEWEAPLPLTPTAANGCKSCVQLTEHGCASGQDKPLECALYPFRVMKLGEHTVVALSRFCKPVAELPLLRLCDFAERNLSEFAEIARNHPKIVKEYNREYIILKIM
jgi:hypothetical protein